MDGCQLQNRSGIKMKDWNVVMNKHQSFIKKKITALKITRSNHSIQERSISIRELPCSITTSFDGECGRMTSAVNGPNPFESLRSSSSLSRLLVSSLSTWFCRSVFFSWFFEILSPPQPRLLTRALIQSENGVLHILRVLMSPMPYTDGSSRNPSMFSEWFDNAEGQYDFVCSICLRRLKYSFNRITCSA